MTRLRTPLAHRSITPPSLFLLALGFAACSSETEPSEVTVETGAAGLVDDLVRVERPILVQLSEPTDGSTRGVVVFTKSDRPASVDIKSGMRLEGFTLPAGATSFRILVENVPKEDDAYLGVWLDSDGSGNINEGDDVGLYPEPSIWQAEQGAMPLGTDTDEAEFPLGPVRCLAAAGEPCESNDDCRGTLCESTYGTYAPNRSGSCVSGTCTVMDQCTEEGFFVEGDSAGEASCIGHDP